MKLRLTLALALFALASTAFAQSLPTPNLGCAYKINGTTVGCPAAVAVGGTGGSTAAAARSALGAAASGANTDLTSIGGLTTPLTVGQGGTGSATAAGARSSLGAAASGANSDITSLTGLTTALPIGEGGTGSTTAAGARTNLGLAAVAASGSASDLGSGTLSGALLPAPTSSVFGGIKAWTCGSHQFPLTIALGVVTCGQPAAADISGLGTGVLTALGLNVGSAGAPVVNGGALGTPSSGTGTNLTGIPTSGLTGVTKGTWTPTDTSGAGLTFTTLDTVYTKIGNTCTVEGGITFPTTANGSVAHIGSLPCLSGATSNAIAGGAPSYTTYGSPFTIIIATGGGLDFYDYSGNPLTDANFSGKSFRFSFTFLTN